MDEDFIGRVCRIARTCGPQQLTKRVIEKTMGLYRRQLKAIPAANVRLT